MLITVLVGAAILWKRYVGRRQEAYSREQLEITAVPFQHASLGSRNALLADPLSQPSFPIPEPRVRAPSLHKSPLPGRSLRPAAVVPATTVSAPGPQVESPPPVSSEAAIVTVPHLLMRLQNIISRIPGASGENPPMYDGLR